MKKQNARRNSCRLVYSFNSHWAVPSLHCVSGTTLGWQQEASVTSWNHSWDLKIIGCCIWGGGEKDFHKTKEDFAVQPGMANCGASCNSLLKYTNYVPIKFGATTSYLPQPLQFIDHHTTRYFQTGITFCRSQSPSGLMHVLSSAVRTLGSWVLIPLEARMCLPSKESYQLTIKFISFGKQILNRNRLRGLILERRWWWITFSLTKR
jgi:hypothetical protein